MSPDLTRRLFRPFVQGTPGERAGHGLGLAVARGIVDLHGGSIEAQSAGPNQGSEFVVPLPASD